MRFTNLPLDGTRVITLALNVPGAMAAERLRDLGASVTKIEPPQGDPLKTVTPHWYSRLTEGVTTVTCDLKTAPGFGLLLEKLADTDLLLTSQRPAALERLGLGWERLHARFPKLCQVAMVGFPAPHQNVSGHDLTYLGSNGLLQPPALPLTLYADVTGSEQAALAAVAVLLGRERAGSVEYVEVAIADAAKRLAAPRNAGLTMAGGHLAGTFPGYNLYRTADGWVAVAALEPHFYRRLCEQLGVSSPSYQSLAACFASQSNSYWSEFAAKHDLPIEPVKMSS
jgi:crotonobetainyl-CoA:carnitine CoA-transferase CaiB-like acyl-CoA transferase